MIRLLRAFVAADEAQDLVEYALLTAFVALACLAGLSVLQNAIGQGYVNWDTAEQNLWVPPPPG